MTHFAHLTLAAFALASPLFDKPRFQPAAETELERTSLWTESMETVSVRLLADGEETTDIPTVHAAVERTLSVTTIDRFVLSAPNRPLELVRTFDDVTLEMESDILLRTPNGDAELAVTGEGDSELESVGVRFQWDADKQAWKKSYAEDYDAPLELLERLEPDAEFIALLPEADEDVEVGDRWRVDAERLPEILSPGGVVPIERTTDLQAIEGVLDPLLLPGPFELLGGEIEGTIEVELVRLEDGEAEMRFKVDVEITSEVPDVIDALLDGAAPPDAAVSVEAALYGTRLEGSGMLVWDLEAAHMRSFRFASDVELDIDVTVDVEIQGTRTAYRLLEERAGTIELTVQSD